MAYLMTATFYVGDAIEVMGKLPEASVDLVLSSPPFLALRSYLPADHESKHLEGGSQATPGEYVDWLLDVVEACARVLAPHGSLCFELGDTYAGSGGAGGDYLNAGLREGQPAFDGSATRGRSQDREYDGGASDRWDFAKPGTNSRLAAGKGWPLAKSLSLIPESFRWAMVYGRNPFTGRRTEPWRLRNVIRWVRPNPPVGALGDKFRPATSELMVFCKAKDRYFDLDAVREPHKPHGGNYRSSTKSGIQGYSGFSRDVPHRIENEAGAPPLDWWNIPLLDGEEPTRYGPKEPPKAQNAGPLRSRAAASGVDGGDLGAYWAPGERMELNPIGAPPLDWWNIPPGGFSGAHYAVWPAELLVKPIKAMTPERVCRTCGEPSRRIVAIQPELNGQRSLANEIASRRVQAGISRADMVAWFPHYKNGESVMAQVSNWELAKNVPSPGDWEILKERLGLSDDLDEVVLGARRWTESTVEYLADGKALAVNERRTGGIGYDRGGGPPAADANRIKADRKAANTFSDCGHNDWRNGVVCDPFAGSGTTLAVATGHGRDAIGIDLDARNYDLALERVGPLILQRGTID